MGEFRVRKIPRDEESMKEIVSEASSREASISGEGGEEEGHEHAEIHEHGGHEDLAHEQVHLLEHMLSQLAQLDSRLASIGSSVSELSSKLEELIKISRALVKITLASMADNRDLRRKLIEEVVEEL